MRTTSNVHTPEQRLAARQLAERFALRSQWRLVLCVSILRTAVTQVLPLCGSAGWWVVPVCLAPGLVFYGLGCLALRISGASSLTACLPRWAVWLVHGLVALALLVEGVADFTALITLFTQGVGAQGTQFTLAAVAAGMLLLCLRREGLARGVYLLRWVLLALLVTAAAGLLGMTKVDHAFPLLGGGMADVKAALLAGCGMGWPLVLPLLGESVRPRRLLEPLPPVLLCCLCVACLNLALPYELLAGRTALADSLVLTVSFQPPFLRLTTICLWMAGLFLCIGSAASLSAQSLLAPAGREVQWLPGVLVVGMAATQLADVHGLWQWLKMALPWLLIPLGAGAALGLITCRRKRK